MTLARRVLSLQMGLVYSPVMGQSAFHARIKGVVQGVAFRYHTRDTALELGLSGWVRNLPGGDVELLAEGEEASLDQLAIWLGHGPPLARVAHVDISRREPSGDHSTFKILY